MRRPFVAGLLLALFVTWPTVVGYVLLGLFMDETAARTKGIFEGLFLTLREVVDKVVDGVADLFKPGNGSTGKP